MKRSSNLTDEQFMHCLELERAYRKEQQSPESIARELLHAHPEIREDLPEIIKELEENKLGLVAEISDDIKRISRYDENTKIFCEGILKYYSIEKLLKLEQNITRLRAYCLPIVSKRQWFRGEKIQQAKEAPIIETVEQQLGNLRRIGSNAIVLCPFHREKTPSFTLFSKSNRWYCFGCHRGGDTISFIRELLHLSFRDAVLYLTH